MTAAPAFHDLIREGAFVAFCAPLALLPRRDRIEPGRRAPLRVRPFFENPQDRAPPHLPIEPPQVLCLQTWATGGMTACFGCPRQRIALSGCRRHTRRLPPPRIPITPSVPRSPRAASPPGHRRPAVSSHPKRLTPWWSAPGGAPEAHLRLADRPGSRARNEAIPRASIPETKPRLSRESFLEKTLRQSSSAHQAHPARRTEAPPGQSTRSSKPDETNPSDRWAPRPGRATTPDETNPFPRRALRPNAAAERDETNPFPRPTSRNEPSNSSVLAVSPRLTTNARGAPPGRRERTGRRSGRSERHRRGARGRIAVRRIPAPARSSRGPHRAGCGGSCRTGVG